MGASVALPSMSASYPSDSSASANTRISVSAGAAAIDHDAVVMLRVRDGETAAFSLILERHRHGLVNFMNRMVQNQGVAEELAQEVFLRVYRARASYEPTAKFTTWFYRIATHVALNWLRDHKKDKSVESLDEPVSEASSLMREPVDGVPTAEERMMGEARLGEVRRAVDRLPAKQRAAVLMHKYEELEYVQIAASLECSESAVKSLLFRAYETLRARLSHLNGSR